MVKMRTFIMLAAVAAMSAAPSISQAQLNGQVLGLEHSYPTYGSNLINLGNKTVGAGVEWNYFGAADIDVSNSNILFKFLISGYWIPGSFNGFRFFDVNNTIPTFTAVSVNGATNMPGFGAANVWFDADNIYVDMQNLPLDPNTIVSIDVTSSPEPASLVLLGTGLIGVFGVARRRRIA